MSNPGELPFVEPGSYSSVCAVIDGCLTCGDVAVPVTVVEAGEPDAVCVDSHGTTGSVGVELVMPVQEGERLLVHGGVAISRLQDSWDEATDFSTSTIWR